MGEFHYADILIAPVISERTNLMMESENKYVFHITPRATKTDVKRAIHERFKVDVRDVNIINLPRKPKKLGRRSYMTAPRRKAVISLVQGQRIKELSEGQYL
ncbi:MAG: 50S ribosomal protein L23 [bacterium]|nr:50S ribosomal protein L23 [bacterium]